MKKLLKATMKIVISFILLIAISITGSYVVNTYAAERTVVDGHSMDDNFYDGENVIANKIIYKFQKPKRFDVVTIYPYGHKHKEDIVEFTQRLATQLSEMVKKDNGEDDVAKAAAEGKKDEYYIKRIIGMPDNIPSILYNALLRYCHDKLHYKPHSSPLCQSLTLYLSFFHLLRQARCHYLMQSCYPP